LLMMVDLDCLRHPELELEPREASLHTWGFFIIYNIFTNLLSLRAVGFIKFHDYFDLNTTSGFVENTTDMFISSITNEKTFINLRLWVSC
jgi:hypothetical protein